VSILPIISRRVASDVERNWLMAAMPSTARQELLAASDVIGLRVGDLIARENTPIDAAWFPDTGCLSVTAGVDQRQVEVGTIGWEGMFGVPLLLGIDVTAFRCIVQVPGTALRVRRERLADIALRYAEVGDLLRRYGNAWMNQVGRIAACNAVHTTEERLARWLLITHDRVPTEVLPLTHEFLSVMLGVRRASVTIAAHALQEAGLIQYHRGHVRVLDRAGLEGAACECYQFLQSEYTTVRAPRLIDHRAGPL
jgi:CRP-like cAMP-binding protein